MLGLLTLSVFLEFRSCKGLPIGLLRPFLCLFRRRKAKKSANASNTIEHAATAMATTMMTSNPHSPLAGEDGSEGFMGLVGVDVPPLVLMSLMLTLMTVVRPEEASLESRRRLSRTESSSSMACS